MFDSVLESATPSTLEAIGNKIIESQDTAVVVDVISLILERNQEGYYENKVEFNKKAYNLVYMSEVELLSTLHVSEVELLSLFFVTSSIIEKQKYLLQF